MSPECRKRTYYGYCYGLIFGGLLTGAALADSQSTWKDVLETAAFAFVVTGPGFAALSMIMGLIADKLEAALSRTDKES